MSKEPISQFFYSHRLKLHFWDWGENDKPNLVLVHGGMDHARSWDRIAEAFLDKFRVVAPDLRGHGDSGWAFGSMYSLAEFVLDLSTLIDILGDRPLYIIGHSLGAAIVLQYAGIYPEKIKQLAAIEGVAAPPQFADPKPAHTRIRDWIESVRNCEKRSPHRYAGLDAACERMRKENSYLSEEMACHLTLYGSNWNPDGTLSWKFDNFFRAISPYSFRMEEACEIWSNIKCPVLLFRGNDSWVEDPEKAGFFQVIPDHRLIRVPKAGHWVHHDQTDLFIQETRNFFGCGK